MLKKIKGIVFAVPASLGGLALTTGQSFAALPTEVTTAVADGKADMLSMAGLMLAVFIALIAFKLIRRAAH